MSKKIFLLISVTLLIYITNLKAQVNRKINFTEYNLKNGLHVILHRDTTTPVVAVSIMYHVGSKNESADRTGFAHFFEHLMFEGSDNIKRGEFFKIAQNAGAENNANTTFDRTFYYEILPSNQLELGLWMEAERLLHLKIDSIGVETQRKVVKEERSQSYDNQPYGSTLEQLFSHAYKVHPYKWLPIGSSQYIDKATLKEFIDFHDLYYVPENATLSIAGDIDINRTKAMIEKYYSDIPRGKQNIIRPKIVEPPQEKEIRDSIYDNIQLPAVIMGYHMPAQGTEDYYALSMLSTLLSDGPSARLTKSIVDKQQKALSVSAFPFGLEDPGLFIIFGISNMGISPNELETAINEEIDKIKTNLISDNEYNKIKNKTESAFINKNSTLAGISEELANYYTYFGDTNLINNELTRYMKVTKEDIKNVANKYLNKNNRTVLYYLPKVQQ
jgi:predicted Zn-dependent peptidase